jgi:hypothetical protein
MFQPGLKRLDLLYRAEWTHPERAHLRELAKARTLTFFTLTNSPRSAEPKCSLSCLATDLVLGRTVVADCENPPHASKMSCRRVAAKKGMP